MFKTALFREAFRAADYIHSGEKGKPRIDFSKLVQIKYDNESNTFLFVMADGKSMDF